MHRGACCAALALVGGLAYDVWAMAGGIVPGSPVAALHACSWQLPLYCGHAPRVQLAAKVAAAPPSTPKARETHDGSCTCFLGACGAEMPLSCQVPFCKHRCVFCWLLTHLAYQREPRQCVIRRLFC